MIEEQGQMLYDDFFQIVIQGVFENERNILHNIAKKANNKEKFEKKIYGFQLKTFKNLRSVNRIWKEHTDNFFVFELDKMNILPLVLHNNLEAVSFFCKRRLINLSEFYDFAIYHDKVEVIRTLLNLGSSPPRGIHIKKAAQFDNKRVIQLLLEDGRAETKGTLDYILDTFKYELVLPFLDQGAEIDNFRGEKLLIWAIKNRRLKIVKLLSKNEWFDPSFGNDQFIKMACKQADLELVQFLCTYDCVDPFAGGKDSGFNQAVKHNRKEIVAFLEENRGNQKE